MGTLRASRRYRCDPFIAKACALLEIVNLCKEVGFSSFILEGNNLQVVKLLGEKIIDWSEGAFIVQDAKTMLNSFANWSIQHIKREGNVVAHNLAKDALNHDVDILELEVVPKCDKDTGNSRCFLKYWNEMMFGCDKKKTSIAFQSPLFI